MVLQFKTVLFRNAALCFFDLGILELHDLRTLAADQMIVVGPGTSAFIVSIATCPEALSDHTRLEKDRKIPVNRVP
jgi:hypothetical protein